MNLRRATRWLAFGTMPVAVVVVLGWLLLVFAVHREGAVPLPVKNGSQIQYRIDAGGRLERSEVAAAPMESWLDWPLKNYVATRRGRVIWARVVIHNGSDMPLRGVLENDDYFADRVDAWTTAAGVPVHLLAGEAVATRLKAIAGREVAFPIDVGPRSEQVVLVKVDDYCGAFARFVWWPDATAFHVARTRAGLAEGIYFGGLIALLGYNIFLWLRLRQPDIGFYVLYLGSVAAFMLFARAQMPALGWALGSPALEKSLTIALGVGGFFLARFSRVFLELKAHFPNSDQLLKGASVVMLLLAAAAVLIPGIYAQDAMRWVVLATAIMHVGLLVLVSAAWRAGVWQARFFVFSFGCLFAGSLLMVAVWFSEAEMRDAGMRVLMIASALEMLLLSLGVADRFARAQRMLVEETEQRRMMEATYSDELEEEVRERTRELQDANIDKDRILAVIGHDLRGPITGLMRSADGTAGDFSRDVARTGRALLLMIEDLVLWTRLRAGARTVSVHRATSLVMPAVALHRALAEYGEIELMLDVPEELEIKTDLVLAQTLVRNLLANALKFAAARVVIRAWKEEGKVHFMVGNDGPALSPAVAARLAAGEDEPMTATGGMGLKLCREICSVLGMTFKANLPPGGGTEFGFTLESSGGGQAKTYE